MVRLGSGIIEVCKCDRGPLDASDYNWVLAGVHHNRVKCNAAVGESSFHPHQQWVHLITAKAQLQHQLSLQLIITEYFSID